MNYLLKSPEQKSRTALYGTLLSLVLLLVTMSTPASADVTVKQSNQGRGLGMSGHVSSTTYIKGDKMRIDDVLGNRTETTIFDLDAQKAYIFNSSRKEADVWNMQALAKETSKSVDASSLKASVTPNGRTKQVDGHMAVGYDVHVAAQASSPGMPGPMMVRLNGTIWIVKGAPGTADFERFYKTAAAKGWIFNSPRAAKAQPAQAEAMTQMYRQVAELGGIPYETDLQIHVSSSGVMGALLARLGKVTSSTVVQSVDTGTLSDSLFAPPPGYRQELRH